MTFIGQTRDRFKKTTENLLITKRFWQAAAVLYMDQRFKRNPTVASRLKHLRAQHAGMQLMLQDPAKRGKLPPEFEQNAKTLGPSLRLLEQAVKKNPNLTMKELSEMAKNPQLQQPRVRTRPGPPMKGKRRF